MLEEFRDFEVICLPVELASMRLLEYALCNTLSARTCERFDQYPGWLDNNGLFFAVNNGLCGCKRVKLALIIVWTITVHR